MINHLKTSHSVNPTPFNTRHIGVTEYTKRVNKNDNVVSDDSVHDYPMTVYMIIR